MLTEEPVITHINKPTFYIIILFEYYMGKICNVYLTFWPLILFCMLFSLDVFFPSIHTILSWLDKKKKFPLINPRYKLYTSSIMLLSSSAHCRSYFLTKHCRLKSFPLLLFVISSQERPDNVPELQSRWVIHVGGEIVAAIVSAKDTRR